MALPTSGNVQVTQQIIYAPPSGVIGTILNMTFNNSLFVSWTLSVWEKLANSNSPKLLYSKTFDAGDTWIDPHTYTLPFGASIQAAASSNSVVFVINGIEN